jgi:hypothetical protein
MSRRFSPTSLPHHSANQSPCHARNRHPDYSSPRQRLLLRKRRQAIGPRQGFWFGYDWTSANPKDVLRVSVQNSFTRDSFVALDGAGKHYELTVGPIKDAFMIVPKGNYEFSAWSFGKSVGNTKYDVAQDDRNGIKGVLVKIRP